MHIVSITKLLAGSAHAENLYQKYNASPLFLALNAQQNHSLATNVTNQSYYWLPMSLINPLTGSASVKLLMKLAEKIPSDWYNLGIHLNLKFHSLAGI